LRVFHADMLARKAELRKMGIEPARVPMPEKEAQ
jgi:hypothetical protein